MDFATRFMSISNWFTIQTSLFFRLLRTKFSQKLNSGIPEVSAKTQSFLHWREMTPITQLNAMETRVSTQRATRKESRRSAHLWIKHPGRATEACGFCFNFRLLSPNVLSYNDLTSCFSTSFGMDRFGTVPAARSVDLCCVGASVLQTHAGDRGCRERPNQVSRPWFIHRDVPWLMRCGERTLGESIRPNARWNGRTGYVNHCPVFFIAPWYDPSQECLFRQWEYVAAAWKSLNSSLTRRHGRLFKKCRLSPTSNNNTNNCKPIKRNNFRQPRLVAEEHLEPLAPLKI